LRIVGRSSPERVTEVVVSCIRKNRSEVLVNTPPERPLVVLANIAPSVTPRVLRLFRYHRTFERAVDVYSKT